MKKYTILMILLIAFFNRSNAQSKNMLFHKANKEFEKMRYSFAIPLFHNYIQKGGSDSTSYLFLAISYAKLNKYDSALVYFEKASKFGLQYHNYLPEMYAINGNYEEAKNEYKKLKESKRSLLVDARLFGFERISNYKTDSFDFQISRLNFNSAFNDFGAVPYKGGLVFESNRSLTLKNKISKKYLAGWDGKNYSHLFFNNGTDSAISIFSPNFHDKLNVGSISFTKDGRFAYYTRNSSKKSRSGVYQLEIWESKFKDGVWTKGDKMFFNNPNFSYFHPFITSEGNRLYFVSDDSTGFGGTDIYFIDKNEDGSWKNTQNAGIDINTQGNELFPTFYENSLYFSSNGHPGLGGLDIYKLVKSNTHKGEWKVSNLGYPINTSKDDFAFSIINNKGYFSSNRTGDDDIYSFSYKQVFVDLKGSVIVDSNLALTNTLYFTYTTSEGLSQTDSVHIDSKGNYSLRARPNNKYNLYVLDNTGAKHSFEINANQFSTNNNTLSQVNAPLQVKPLEDQLQKIKERKEAFVKADLAVMTKKFKRAIDSLGTMTKDMVVLHHLFDQVYVEKEDLNDYYGLIERVKRLKGKRIVIVSAADCAGDEKYNDDLSKRRANRIFKTLNGLSENEVLIKSVGESELLIDCIDLVNQKNNRYSYVFIMNK